MSFRLKLEGFRYIDSHVSTYTCVYCVLQFTLSGILGLPPTAITMCSAVRRDWNEEQTIQIHTMCTGGDPQPCLLDWK